MAANTRAMRTARRIAEILLIVVLGRSAALAAEPIFREATASPMNNDAVNMAAGDLDGDGDLDMAVAQQTRGLEILLNRGSAGFAAGVIAVELGVFNVQNVEIGDVDGDGDRDV